MSKNKDTIVLTDKQLDALKCAIADLQGAIQKFEQNDPMVDYDVEAAQQSIDDLIAAFPVRRLKDWYTPLPYPED